jgi:hypothetical protein
MTRYWLNDYHIHDVEGAIKHCRSKGLTVIECESHIFVDSDLKLSQIKEEICPYIETMDYFFDVNYASWEEDQSRIYADQIVEIIYGEEFDVDNECIPRIAQFIDTVFLMNERENLKNHIVNILSSLSPKQLEIFNNKKLSEMVLCFFIPKIKETLKLFADELNRFTLHI